MINSILDLITKYSLPIIEDKHFDFSNPTLISDIETLSKQFIANRNKISVPPISTLLIQRKIGGMFMLARRFRARIDLKTIIHNFI